MTLELKLTRIVLTHRQEASKHPAVFTAQHNPYLIPALSIASTSSLQPQGPILPSQEWRDTFVLRFKAMREVSETSRDHSRVKPANVHLNETGTGSGTRCADHQSAFRSSTKARQCQRLVSLYSLSFSQRANRPRG